MLIQRQALRLLQGLVIASLLQACQTTPVVNTFNCEQEVDQRQENIACHEFQLLDNQGLVGHLAKVDSRETDTLSDLARHYGLGYNDIALANPQLDPWLLSDDLSVLLPLQFLLPEAPRKGIVLNLANMRLFYYPKNQRNTVMTYPVGIGRDGWNTPLGQTTVVEKRAFPAWTVPKSILREHQELGDPLPAVIQAGPDNPLGNYAMPLGFNGYLIHGTNKPYGIGMQVSHGCVQMYPEDIEKLFNKVEVNTPVRIVHQPYLAAWDQGMLYLEAHQPLEKWAKQTVQLQKDLKKKLKQLAAEQTASVDWDKVEQILHKSDGIPMPVLSQSSGLAEIKQQALALKHPDSLSGQPQVAEIGDSDWSLLAASFSDAAEAQKLAAMLNHQGPPIPARKQFKDGQFQVIAGPFKSQKQVKSLAKRIKQNFELDAMPLAPVIKVAN